MLRPQQQSEFLTHDSPSVFGKPWYWQRSSSTMESTRSLAQVIMEMRDEIKKLEAENRELRGEYGHTGSEQVEIAENPYVNLRRNASAPDLEGQFKDNSVMTVRRYSTSSNFSGVTVTQGRTDRVRRSNSRWSRLQEEIQHGNDLFSNPSKAEGEKVNSRHSLQTYVHKNRTKVKTVTFLLPVEDIYTNRPALFKQQDEPKIRNEAFITETDS